jgi:GNAT superfamily N-acetyltransferase
VEGVLIRAAEFRDRLEVWSLVEDFASSYLPDSATFQQSFGRLLSLDDTLVLVAETHESTVVGYLLASYHGTFFANGPVAWIEEVMVAQNVRRRGVGSALIASAEAWAEGIPAAYIALASRRAGLFYIRIGYEESAAYFRKTFLPPIA